MYRIDGIDSSACVDDVRPARIRVARGDGVQPHEDARQFRDQLVSVSHGRPGHSTGAGIGEAVVAPSLASENPSGDEVRGLARRQCVFGWSPGADYAGDTVALRSAVASGYLAGPFRHQLTGFDTDRFDPTHPDGMTLKMIAARVFERFDVYSLTAVSDVVAALNNAGIPARQAGPEQIDFGNGEGPIDVVRNVAGLRGDSVTGKWWQWSSASDGSRTPDRLVTPTVYPASGAPTLASAHASAAPPSFQAPARVEATASTLDAAGIKPDELSRILQRYIAIWLGMVTDFALQRDRSAMPTDLGMSSEASSITGGIGAVQRTSTPLASLDQLDLSTVEWLHTDASQWRVTSEISEVTITPESVTIDHTRSGAWPRISPNGVEIEGNPWIFVNRGGRWYAATYEWLRPGQTKKGVTAENIGAHTKREPLTDWHPQPGEVVGFMVSTPARNSARTTNERTNVVLARWPG